MLLLNLCRSESSGYDEQQSRDFAVGRLFFAIYSFHHQKRFIASLSSDGDNRSVEFTTNSRIE